MGNCIGSCHLKSGPLRLCFPGIRCNFSEIFEHVQNENKDLRFLQFGDRRNRRESHTTPKVAKIDRRHSYHPDEVGATLSVLIGEKVHSQFLVFERLSA